MGRMIVAVAVMTFASVSIGAQGQNPPPLQGGQVTAAEIAAIVAKQPKDRTGNYRFLQLAPYNVLLEHRVNMPQNAVTHDKQAELFYVIDGGATLVTGGHLVDQKPNNADNWTAKSSEGGTSRQISKGDFILVPEGVPHWFSKIDGELTLMSLKLPRTPTEAPTER